ncbi:hypothetical protein [Lysobacter sp. HA18]
MLKRNAPDDVCQAGRPAERSPIRNFRFPSKAVVNVEPGSPARLLAFGIHLDR